MVEPKICTLRNLDLIHQEIPLTAFQKPASAFFSAWAIPPPLGKENIITPCYESLVGAGYALLKAEEYNYAESSLKDYNVGGFEGCLRLIAKGSLPQDNDWLIWECGFYFLSAIHRIVWVHERLIKIFTCLPLAEDCGGHLSAKQRREIITAAIKYGNIC